MMSESTEGVLMTARLETFLCLDYFFNRQVAVNYCCVSIKSRFCGSNGRYALLLRRPGAGGCFSLWVRYSVHGEGRRAADREQ